MTSRRKIVGRRFVGQSANIQEGGGTRNDSGPRIQLVTGPSAWSLPKLLHHCSVSNILWSALVAAVPVITVLHELGCDPRNNLRPHGADQVAHVLVHVFEPISHRSIAISFVFVSFVCVIENNWLLLIMNTPHICKGIFCCVPNPLFEL